MSVDPKPDQATPDWPADLPSVSRETRNRLIAFQSLVLKWNKSINLIAPNSTQDIWHRHIIDSAQLINQVEGQSSWLDLGSGAGFPGVVAAVLCKELHPQMHVTLVESDQRKSIFLQQAAQHLDLNITVNRARIEDLDASPFDIISARALAPLAQIFSYAHRFCDESTMILLLKGETADRELTEAAGNWHSHTRAYPSLTHPKGKILKITGLRKRI